MFPLANVSASLNYFVKGNHKYIMDINLPLILFIAVVSTGLVWIIDAVFFQRKRQAAVATVDGQFNHLSEEQKAADNGYVSAVESVSTEPLIVEYSKSFFPVLLIVFVLRSFVVEPFQIPSESMVPTLEVGDFILVNKFTYGIRLPLARTKVIEISDPKRGDVMVFFPPHQDRYFIKRVIGLPGDTVRLKDGALHINGEKIPQTLAYTDTKTDAGCVVNFGKYVVLDESFDGRSHQMRRCQVENRSYPERVWEVPEGHYFMMGDNRDNSLDSRSWGTVPEERIVGKAFAIWMHWDSFLSIPSFSRVGTI